MTGYYVPPSDLDPVERALSYPYEAPRQGYIFRDGAAEPVARMTAAARGGRIPVLAYGSNRAPAQLARKFADRPGTLIPVEPVVLVDFDVVHAAHLSGYGAVSATIAWAPGARAEAAITWLAPDQMERMHATEGVGTYYDYRVVEGARIEMADGDSLGAFHVYVCSQGALGRDGAPLALEAVRAAGRRLAAASQAEAQALAMAKLDHPGPVERFIRENIADRALRDARERRLAADALPFAWPGSCPADR